MKGKMKVESLMDLTNKAYERFWWWQAQAFGFADGI
jgi:hypothetical protein